MFKLERDAVGAAGAVPGDRWADALVPQLRRYCDAQRGTHDAERSSHHTQCSAYDAQCGTYDTQCRTYNAKCSTHDTHIIRCILSCCSRLLHDPAAADCPPDTATRFLMRTTDRNFSRPCDA